MGGCASKDTSTQLSSQNAKQRQINLKAQESAARLQAMMAELGIQENGQKIEYEVQDDSKLIAALQRQWYGCAHDIPKEHYSLYLQATLCVASVDGVDPAEASWLKARTLLLGLNEIQRNRLLSQPLRSDSACVTAIEKLREQTTKAVSQMVYYDAVTMACQDGFTLDERVRAMRAAQLLGLTDDVRLDVEALCEAEDALRKRKIRYFGFIPDDDPEAEAEMAAAVGAVFQPKDNQQQDVDNDVTIHGGLGTLSAQVPVSRQRRDALQRLVYGTVIPIDPDIEKRYVPTLVSVAGADGLSNVEKEWLTERQLVLGLPPQNLNTLLDEECAQQRLAQTRWTAPWELFGKKAQAVGGGGPYARAVLLDALMFAAQDGLSQEESERSKSSATQLGLDEATRKDALQLVHLEMQLQAQKAELFRVDISRSGPPTRAGSRAPSRNSSRKPSKSS